MFGRLFERFRSTKPRWISDVQRLQLQPGDVLVISYDEPLSDETCERLKREVEAYLNGVKVLVIGHGGRVGAIGPANQLGS